MIGYKREENALGFDKQEQAYGTKDREKMDRFAIMEQAGHAAVEGTQARGEVRNGQRTGSAAVEEVGECFAE